MTDISRLDQTIVRGYMSQALYFAVATRVAAGYSIVDGLKVQQRAAGANMSVDVDSGNVKMKFHPVAITGANKSIDSSDPTNPRIDILYLTTAGVITISKGTAAAIVPAGESTWQEYQEPYPADMKAVEGVLLAAINVGAGATAIYDSDILMLGGLSGQEPVVVKHIASGQSYEFATDQIITGTMIIQGV